MSQLIGWAAIRGAWYPVPSLALMAFGDADDADEVLEPSSGKAPPKKFVPFTVQNATGKRIKVTVHTLPFFEAAKGAKPGVPASRDIVDLPLAVDEQKGDGSVPVLGLGDTNSWWVAYTDVETGRRRAYWSDSRVGKKCEVFESDTAVTVIISSSSFQIVMASGTCENSFYV